MFKVSAELFAFATLQLTGTVAPAVVVAVQDSLLPDETVDAEARLESKHVTMSIAVAATMVSVVVPVKVDCTWEVAVIVTVLVGGLEGAVYKPALVIDPALPVPPPVTLTLQFTRVLLSLTTVAVHCAVPRTVTSDPVPWVGTHEAVMVGVATVLGLLPQELRIAGTAISAKKRRRSQRTLSRSNWKFGSSTRNPPARTTLIFLRKMQPLCSRYFQVTAAHSRRGLATTRRAHNLPTERTSLATIRRNAAVCR